MFGIDGGVMFHGHPQVDDLVATGQLGSNPAAQPNLASEEQRLRDKASDYAYYPVLQLSLGYRFQAASTRIPVIGTVAYTRRSGP